MLRAFVGLAVWACAATALAQEATPPEPTPEQIAEARELFESATLAYEAGDYAEAQAGFRAAYDLTHHPDLLYNIYTSAERNGDTQLAIDSLEGYLEAGEMEDIRRNALEARMERLRLRLEREQREAADQERALAEREEQLAEEQVERQNAEVRAEEAQAQHLEGVRAGHATSDALTFVGVGSLIAGGVAAVLFATFAGLSEAEDQSIASSCGADALRVCNDDEVDTLRQWNLAADVSWIAAAGFGAVGLSLLLIGIATRPSEAGDVALRPVLAPTAGGLIAEGRW